MDFDEACRDFHVNYRQYHNSPANFLSKHVSCLISTAKETRVFVTKKSV